MGPHTITHESVSLSWDDPADSSVAGYQILHQDRSLLATGEYIELQEDPETAETCYVGSEVEAGRR
ncbi:MAG: hypothetical protein OXE05_14625 [Chloroflexi bacterium]|nr:hypothetical protein [Chloroflexota bacterium]